MKKPYFTTAQGKLYRGDCLNVLKGRADNSVDLIVTDPPYGYSFMGKDWDKVVIGTETWAECARVLKPGAFAFIMSAPRQDVLARMIVNLQDAGFETGFTSIYWAYASGFPKAGNIGKLVDKKLGFERERVGKIKNAIPRLRSGKGGTETKTNDGRDLDNWEKYANREYQYITKPSSPQAKALDGSYTGFQPKPAVEVILVVMKPLSEGGYTDQAMANGKGITWLGNCRMPYESEEDYEEYKIKRESFDNQKGKIQTLENSNVPFMSSPQTNTIHNKGRFPANLLVSDDALDDGEIRQSGFKKGGQYKGGTNQCAVGGADGTSCYEDSGSFSRYFDLDRWWIEQLPESVRKTFPFLIVPKASRGEKNKGCDELEEKSIQGRDEGQDKLNVPYKQRITPVKNNHPTVKPLKLFSYLITLGSQPGDLILDPFIGSGTMGVACELMKTLHEEKHRQWIGIEQEEKYCKIAMERIKKEYTDREFRWELFE